MKLNEQYSNPTIESSLKDWREQGGLTRLEGSKCMNCGNLYFPRRFVCPVCYSQEMEIFQFSGNGKIKNIEKNSLYQVAVEGYREKPSRYMAIIELEEGIDVLGEIIESESSIIKIGASVSMVVRKQSRSANTTWKYGYKFKVRS